MEKKPSEAGARKKGAAAGVIQEEGDTQRRVQDAARKNTRAAYKTG